MPANIVLETHTSIQTGNCKISSLQEFQSDPSVQYFAVCNPTAISSYIQMILREMNNLPVHKIQHFLNAEPGTTSQRKECFLDTSEDLVFHKSLGVKLPQPGKEN